MYSITSKTSFDLIPKFKQKIYMVKDEETYFPLVLVPTVSHNHIYNMKAGNKCDLQECREVSTEDGRLLASSIGCPFFETSAKTKLNIENSFIETVREIKKRRDLENSGKPSDSKRRACALF